MTVLCRSGTKRLSLKRRQERQATFNDDDDDSDQKIAKLENSWSCIIPMMIITSISMLSTELRSSARLKEEKISLRPFC